MHSASNMTHLHIIPQFKIMVSATDLAKRALVLLLQKLATLYNVVLNVTRSSPDADIRRAYHRLSKKCHPDRGGENEHQQALNNAHRQWEDAKRGASSQGRPRKKPAANVGRSGNPAPSDSLAISFEAHDNRKQFRFRSCAVLLTFQKFPDPCVWTEFLSFLKEHLLTWGVQFWCATMETNTDLTYHFHVALHFRVAGEPRMATARNMHFKNKVANSDAREEGRQRAERTKQSAEHYSGQLQLFAKGFHIAVASNAQNT